MTRTGRRPTGLLILAALAAVSVFALAGGAAAESSEIGQPMAQNLVEIKVADRAAVEQLMVDAESVGAEFNDHYLRQNEDDGTVTVQVLGDDSQIAALHDMGYELLGTIEDEEAYWDRIAERLRAIEAERKADQYAETGRSPDFNRFGLRAGVAATVTEEITINRVDYFQNYAGRFLSVEAFNATTVQQTGGGQTAGQGPTLSVTWDGGPGTAIGSGGPRTMAPYVDPDPAQDTYLYHRMLIRLGAPNTDTPPRPSRIRIASSSGAIAEADVNTWIGQSLPPHASGFLRGFHNRYMDPTEIYQRFEQLAAEFGGPGGIAELINLPNKTNGYQRKAQVTMDPPGARMTVNAPNPAAGTYTVAQATYGPATPAAGISGSYALVQSTTGTPSEGCGPITGFPAGSIALVDRGNCNFADKTFNAQQAGAVAVVIVNNVPGAPTAPGGTAIPGTTIPTVQVGQADGNLLKANLPANGTVFGATATSNASRVVLTSRAWGHEGGNDIKAQFVNPGAANSPLSVSALGNEITVRLATNASGALSSTAAQVVAAINASPAASALVKALTFQNSTGTGVVPATLKLGLSDFLAVSQAVPASGIPHDNSHVQRGPFQPKVMRIGKVRDGSKVGIYLFCQQHAREWVTPITCLETAEELLRNYAIDPETKDLVDNLDIFILPSVNVDGAHYSFYNFQSQRKNMTNHCVNGAKEGDDPMAADFWTPRANPGTGALYTQTDPGSRNVWGVDLNRNQSVGTIWDGYVGASHSCNSETYAGPGEVSEPEAKNEAWIVDVLGPNIKFSNNIHTSGGYFMWAPGSYKPTRETLPAPNIGIEKYFFAAAETVLGRIKEYRGNVVLPERTGPIADVLYSAAGNSADDNYYRKGIIGYSFEAGSDLFTNATLTQPAAPGATGIRSSSTTGMAAGDTITVGWNGPNPETRKIASISNAGNPNPNVLLTEPLASAHAVGEVINGGTAQSGVGFFPDYGSEGQHEANEFAAGNFGLLEAALAYSRDKTAPLARMTGDRISSGDPIRTTFEYVNEPSVIYYTVDGSMPTFDSPKWERQGLRRPGEVFEFSENTTVRWLALDLAGNTSRGVARFSIGEQYAFGGFRSPIASGVNERTAGATVPVKFAITGHSSPADVTDVYSETADCQTREAAWTGVGSPVESFSAVTVNPTNGQYQVDWKTSKTWKGTCRALILVLSDNTEHAAFFRFK
jgi:zinc carboxypeptidase/PA domain-containing protein/chitobiase/beta-hexosaminidase-like protein